MKKNFKNWRGRVAVLICAVVATMLVSFTPYDWERYEKPVVEWMIKSLGNGVISATLDTYFARINAGGSHGDLDALNWDARTNFYKYNSPWPHDGYYDLAYDSYSAFGDTALGAMVTKNSHADWYFERDNINPDLAPYALAFRRYCLEIAKFALSSSPRNVQMIYDVYKDTLVSGLRGQEETLLKADALLNQYLNGPRDSLSKYDYEFFQRRAKMGGFEIIAKYREICQDLLVEIRKPVPTLPPQKNRK